MKYISYSFKQSLYNMYVILLNIFYYIRFYWKIKRGYFNNNFSNEKDKNGWEITFNDEFENNEINFTNNWNKWHSENTTHSSENMPNEISLDCLEIKDNKLHIFTKKNEKYPHDSDFPLKSGLINSAKWEDKYFEQQYGFFETSCKVPISGLKSWPAFWLYGDKWPPEIDIFEFMSEKDTNINHTKRISMTTHWGTNGKIGMNKQSQLGRTLGKFFGLYINFDENFHTYSCRWEWNYIEWYIDNIPVYRTTYNIPNNNMSIILNTAGHINNIPKDNELPYELIVDYVRCYKKIY